jgi:excisionase family DNA binding protein
MRGKGKVWSGIKRRLVRTREAAEYLAVSKTKIREMAWAGAIPFIQEKENALMLFDIGDLDRWIETNKEGV